MSFPFHLVVMGIGLGYFARIAYPPETEVLAPRVMLQPLQPTVENDASEEVFTDLPLIK